MSIISQQYITDITSRINSVPDCATLSALESEVFTYMNTLLSSTISQLELLKPLTSIPSSISDVISWVTTFINSTLLAPYQKALLLEAELIADIALLMTAINSKYASLTCSFTPLQGIVANAKTAGTQLAGSAFIGG